MKREALGIIGLAVAGGLTLSLFGEPGEAADYAVVREGEVIELRFNYSPPPPDKIDKENGVLVVRPYVRVKPAYDPATEVLEGPTRTITDTEVTDTWTVRPKTAQEIDDYKTSQVNGMGQAIIAALCHLKNEVRTKVDGVAAWSKAQCLAAFKTLLP